MWIKSLAGRTCVRSIISNGICVSLPGSDWTCASWIPMLRVLRHMFVAGWLWCSCLFLVCGFAPLYAPVGRVLRAYGFYLGLLSCGSCGGVTLCIAIWHVCVARWLVDCICSVAVAVGLGSVFPLRRCCCIGPSSVCNSRCPCLLGIFLLFVGAVWLILPFLCLVVLHTCGCSVAAAAAILPLAASWFRSSSRRCTQHTGFGIDRSEC